MASFGLLVIVFLVVIVLASVLGRRDPVWLKALTSGADMAEPVVGRAWRASLGSTRG